MTAYCFRETLQAIPAGEPFTGPDGRGYPPNWLELATPDDIEAAGIAVVVETDRPGADFVVTGVTIEDVAGVPTQVWQAEDLGLADLRALRIQQVREVRAQHETAGIVVSGIPIPSDERIQNRLANALQAFAVDDELVTVDWEFGFGQFATMDQATVAAIGVALSRHIQACFSRSRELITAIQAGDRAAVLALDITTGWPS
jgi:hypothetical protein